VFGRTRTEKRADPATGRVQTRVRQLPREQWEVLIPDHHPGFISWSVFEANTARLRANWRPVGAENRVTSSDQYLSAGQPSGHRPAPPQHDRSAWPSGLPT
jgi:hypothetical protein